MILGDDQPLRGDLEQRLAQWTGADFITFAEFLELQPFTGREMMADDVAPQLLGNASCKCLGRLITRRVQAWPPSALRLSGQIPHALRLFVANPHAI